VGRSRGRASIRSSTAVVSIKYEVIGHPGTNNVLSTVLLASQNKEFSEFWSRVCKFAGATIRFIKSESDITSNLTGYMLTDQEFPDDIKLEAQRKGKRLKAYLKIAINCLKMLFLATNSHSGGFKQQWDLRCCKEKL
jgi:BRCA1 C Terminus (BRCT) domain